MVFKTRTVNTPIPYFFFVGKLSSSLSYCMAFFKKKNSVWEHFGCKHPNVNIIIFFKKCMTMS